MPLTTCRSDWGSCSDGVQAHKPYALCGRQACIHESSPMRAEVDQLPGTEPRGRTRQPRSRPHRTWSAIDPTRRPGRFLWDISKSCQPCYCCGLRMQQGTLGASAQAQAIGEYEIQEFPTLNSGKRCSCLPPIPLTQTTPTKHEHVLILLLNAGVQR